MYEEAFKVVASHVPELKPSYVITDFEIGAINAAKKYFPLAKMHGCFFHLCQSLWRRIQQLGLQSRYTNEPNFALNVRQLLALAFVPPKDVTIRFTELCKSEFWTADPDNVKLHELLDYFESTYIGVETRNKSRRPVTFPPTMWSVYEITILGTTLNNFMFNLNSRFFIM